MDDLETREAEDRLSAALRTRAGRIDPPDRFAEVLEGSTSAGRGRRWLPPAAAAAVLAMVVGLWVLETPTTGPAPTVPASSGPSAPAPSATAPTSTAPTPSPSSTAPAPPEKTLPVYVTSPEALGEPGSGYGLRRLWITAPVVGEEDEVRSAVDASLDAPVDGVDTPPWSGVDVVAVDVADDAVTVVLSGPPRSAGTRVDGLALPQVAWTAQAVLGAGNLPVTVTADGTTLGVVTRPPAAEWWTVLTDVWITGPDAPVPGDDVVVTGEASVFEAALVWRLEQDGAVVGSGSTTASAGAPERGTWRVDLGRLDPGEYTVRVEALSPKDGSVAADDTRTLRVSR